MYSQIPRRYDSGSDTNGYANIPSAGGAVGFGGVGATAPGVGIGVGHGVANPAAGYGGGVPNPNSGVSNNGRVNGWFDASGSWVVSPNQGPSTANFGWGRGQSPAPATGTRTPVTGGMTPGGSQDWRNVGRTGSPAPTAVSWRNQPATGGQMMPLSSSSQTSRMMPTSNAASSRMMPLAANGTSNGQVSGGGWTPAPIASAAPINLGGLVGSITAGQQAAAQAAAAAANQAAKAPGIIRIPQPGYFGNSGIGFGAGTANADIGGINMYGGGGRLYGDPINGTNWLGDTVMAGVSGIPSAGGKGDGSSSTSSGSAYANGSGKGDGSVSGGSGAYDPNNPLGSIFGAFQDAQDSALAANEQRYQDILAGWQDTYNMALGDINNLGEQQREDVRTDYMRQGEELKSSLVDRGMSNTTVRDTMLAGNLSEQENSLNRLEDSLIRERMNIALPLRTGMLGFMERREDQYPDMGQLMQLAQMLGMSGNGTGGGGGTNYGAISAAMQGVGNVGGFAGAGGFGGGFGGANGNMGNVWGGQGGNQGGNQQGNQGGAAGQNQGPNLAQGNVAQVGIDNGLNPYQQELAAYNKLYGWSTNTDELIKQWKKNNPGKSLTDVLNEQQQQQQPANNQQAFNFQPAQQFQNVFDPYVFDYPTYDPYQNSYYDPYQGYYSDPYSTPYDYSNSPGYYS